MSCKGTRETRQRIARRKSINKKKKKSKVFTLKKSRGLRRVQYPQSTHTLLSFSIPATVCVSFSWNDWLLVCSHNTISHSRLVFPFDISRCVLISALLTAEQKQTADSQHLTSTLNCAAELVMNSWHDRQNNNNTKWWWWNSASVRFVDLFES